MEITYLGHGCLSIEIAGKNIIVDPFITGNEMAKHIKINQLKADYILITHAHFDHVADVELIAKRTSAKLVSNYEIVTYYQEKGLDGHPMNHGGSWQFDFGRLTYTNAIHTSSFQDGTYGGQPGGFLLETNEANIYVAGDTALTYDMKLIPMQTKLDLAVLPIGDNFTMGVDAAIIASDFVECDKILGYHYDTFGYIKIDHVDAKSKFLSKNKELILLDIGKSINI
jgi:L-ascorbate metabolism protein UlaG (beta-lactamase superfamily)